MSDIVILDEEKESASASPKKKYMSTSSILDSINNYLLDSQNIKLKQKLIFYRMLATMVNSWISLLKSISILEEQEEDKIMKRILGKMIVAIREWKSFSDSLNLFPNSFDWSEIWVIESWEKTWKLNSSLIMLADQIEKVTSINKKIKGAMIYPTMIIGVTLTVVSVLMTVVVPKLIELFPNKDKLPGSTKTLLAISDFMSNSWHFVVIAIVFAVISITLWKKTPTWKFYMDMFLLKLPIFWNLVRKVTLVKFTRILSSLLGSWVSIVESLRITSEALWNEVYKQRVLLLREDVKKWLRIWEWLDWDKLFPVMLVQMIKIWEQTAQTDKVIIKIASFYEEEVDTTVWTLNKLIEPLIIAVMALVVGFIAIWVMEPIMWLADQVSGG